MMMKKLILPLQACAAPVASALRIVLMTILLASWYSPVDCNAQSAEEQQVKAVVEQLFRAMELGDSSLAHKCFMPQVTTATVKTSKEELNILTRENGVAEFLKAIGTPHSDKWYEEIWNVKITMDGALAQVWCDYAFYLGNKFSHCGVDAFHLFNDKGTWKIFHLADTRKATGCNIPQEIAAKHAQ